MTMVAIFLAGVFVGAVAATVAVIVGAAMSDMGR